MNKKGYSIYNQIAQIYAREHLFEKAVDFYKTVREISGNNKLYARELAGIYKLQMDYENAIKEYLNILNLKSLRYVKYYLEKLECENKIVIDAIKERVGDSKQNLYKKLLGKIYLSYKKYEDAFEIYQSLGVKSMLQFASICLKNHNFNLGITTYLEVLQNDKINNTVKFEIYKKVGDLYYKTHRYQKAREYYSSVLSQAKILSTKTYQTNFTLFETYIQLSRIEYHINNSPSEARKYIMKARNLPIRKKYDVKLDIFLADCFLFEKKYKKAIEIYENIIQKNNKDNTFFLQSKYKLYQASVFSEQYAKSDSLFKKFIKENYRNEYFNDLVSLHFFLKNIKLKSANDSLKIYLIHFLQKLEGLDIKRLESSYKALLQVIKDNSNSSFIKLSLANYYFDNFYYEKALKIYLDLEKMDLSGKTETDSLKISEEGISGEKEFIQKQIGDCYYFLENQFRAEVYYKDYLKSFPAGSYATEIRQKLE